MQTITHEVEIFTHKRWVACCQSCGWQYSSDHLRDVEREARWHEDTGC